MSTREDYIGVFDSGVGGISVLRQLRRELPGERFLYFGDSANAPYGSRPTPEVRQLSCQVAQRLMDRGIKALVVACNTATAAAIEELRQQYPQLPIVGIEPALKLACDRFPGRTIGVMATEVTLREEKFAGLMARCSRECQVVKLPAPGLVELVEAGLANSLESEALLRNLLGEWVGKLDALVLGCTHYPFAAPAISRILGEETVLLDGGVGTARQTRRLLEAQGLLWNGEGEVIFENSLDSQRITQLCRQLLEQP